VLISCIALAIAVPFSVGAAIYVNRIATRLEQNIIKPVIEMVQAIPSVVLGIFGILVLGEGLREFSQVEALSWIPGFPMQERLNILNAGLLLALMAVPTIFTLCEDALNNVPRSFSEASLALGASRIQTVIKVILPTAISGIFAAILLGLGRVIGETMVVLLVAGNKIAMPDWGAGVGVVAQPTHTMTGIIAQEMGEVADGTLHWRALFLVGLVLFTISLCINVAAQRIIRRLSHL
jgi:phosphate transport system permease protein